MAPAETTTAHPPAHLAGRLLARDAAAFEEFALSYGPELRNLAIAKRVPRHDAEDVVHNVLLWIYNHIERFNQDDGMDGFDAWVFTQARWTCVHYLKDRGIEVQLDRKKPDLDGRRGASEEEVLWAQEWFSAERAGEKQDGHRAQALAILVERLSPADREILHLRELGLDLKYPEIAAKLAIPEGTARQRHKRAKDRLSRLMAADPDWADLANENTTNEGELNA